jgi:dTDP-4-dehydrorhamnose 3,5-epimerase
MVFTETGVTGAYLVDVESTQDERGFFARSWCQREFARRGLNGQIVQCNISRNHQRGTLRGLHYQTGPHKEAKLVRCTRGAIFDVVLDLRPRSNTYLRHDGVLLTEDNHRALYIPEGCGHGFLTLSEGAEVFYQMSQFYEPSAARGVRWNDPAFNISWPEIVRVISERDRSYPDFEAISEGNQL